MNIYYNLRYVIALIKFRYGRVFAAKNVEIIEEISVWLYVNIKKNFFHIGVVEYHIQSTEAAASIQVLTPKKPWKYGKVFFKHTFFYSKFNSLHIIKSTRRCVVRLSLTSLSFFLRCKGTHCLNWCGHLFSIFSNIMGKKWSSFTRMFPIMLSRKWYITWPDARIWFFRSKFSSTVIGIGSWSNTPHCLLLPYYLHLNKKIKLDSLLPGKRR